MGRTRHIRADTMWKARHEPWILKSSASDPRRSSLDTDAKVHALSPEIAERRAKIVTL
jgi:hypothetical protein